MIYIVYKSLIQVGGAEKFLIEFLVELKKIKNVKLICKEVNTETMNFFSLRIDDIITPKKNNYASWFSLLNNEIKKNDTVIIQSGFKDLYIISLFKKISMIFFLHHPHFNSLDHFDLLSVIHSKKRKVFLENEENQRFYRKLLLKYKRSSGFFKTNLLAILNFLSIRRANEIIVLSEYAKEEKKLYFNKDSIYIPPAISPKFIDESIASSNIQKKDQIIYFGRLSKEKRVDILIDSFNKIKSDFKLKIIGDGEERESLQLKAKKNKNIVFTGFLDNTDLFEEIKSSKLMVTLEWADYNLTVYESIILGTRVLFGKTFGVENFDKPLLNNKMLFYCNPSINDIAIKIDEIIKMDNPTNTDYAFLRNLSWKNYVEEFTSKIKLL